MINPMTNKQAVFFDRDGVINEAIWRNNKATSPRNLDEWQWVDGIHEAIATLKTAGFCIFVITNQPDVHRQLVRQEMLDAFHQKIQDELDVDELAACMHDDEHQCECRKPKPGMILNLAKKWNISLKDSFVIGDTIRDMEAAKAAGCTGILLNKTYNQGVKSDLNADDLKQAVALILNQ